MIRWFALAAAGCTFATTPKDTGEDTTDDSGVTTVPPTGSGLVQDQIVQDVVDSLDVLWVVDGAVDTTGLAELGSIPFDFLVGTGIDYHLGVVPADLSDPTTAGHLVEAAGLRWVEAETPNPIGVFGQLLAGASDPAAVAQGRGAAYTAIDLEGSGSNLGFTRGAPLHLVLVGDGTDETDPTLIDEAGFVSWLDGLHPDDRSYACLTVGPPVSDACALTAAAIGGVVAEASDTEALSELGLDWVGLERTFALSQPFGSGLEVEVLDGGATLAFVEGADYTYDPVANAITFVEYIPSAGATVVIRYTAGP
ncbi:MAG: hypothetical protein ABMA64_15895 [Myxococcota bacterium]